MSTTDVRSEGATGGASAGNVDMKLEVVTIPVSDVDRATEFYARLGWRQDATPPGSGIVSRRQARQWMNSRAVPLAHHGASNAHATAGI